MSDLDSRLARGPLRVRSVWTPGSVDRLARDLRHRRRFFFAFNLIAVIASLALVVLVGRKHSDVRETTKPPETVPFADGSKAELAGRDTELRIEEDSATRVVSRLKGGARFQVVPNHARSFEVRAGDVRVRVLGTIFSVQELPNGETQVLVERGRVEVAWIGGSAVLEAGQGGTFPPSGGAEERRSPPDASGVESVSPPSSREPSHGTPQPPPSSPHGVGTGGWREEARAGNYGRAFEDLRAKGHDPVHDETDDLMLAADVARLSAHPEEAIKPLRAVVDHHGSDRRAPIAAFTLGRVLLDDLGRPAEAATAFQRARVLWPAGPLTEDARAREAEAWGRAGRTDAARAAAKDYLVEYPHGQHASAMQQILAE